MQMGSGASKSDANGVTLPAKFRPVFLQRIEELTARRHGRPLKDSTPSKKELLLHESDEASLHNHENSKFSKNLEEQIPKAKGSDKEKGVPTRINTTQDVVKVERLKEKCKDERKDTVVQDEKDNEEDVFKDFDDDDEDDDGDDDDDRRMIGHEDDEAFAGSPSFRVYFNDNGEDHHHDDDIGKDDVHESKAPTKETVSVPTKVIIHEKHSPSFHEHTSIVSQNPSVRKQVKTRKKRRSFKHVFQQGGQAAVKNILNVTACYTPSHSSQERNRLLAEKANA